MLRKRLFTNKIIKIMKKSLFLMGLFALLISCKGNVSKNIPQTDKPQPVNLILDTDLGPDYDDVALWP